MLLAVHISDGVLAAPWLQAGYAVAALLLIVSAWRVREEEIPRIALLTAVFFVVSLIHVRVGFTSVHLLMNGLIGVLLGPRAALAIFSGLFLQYWLMPLPHGGIQTLGVNTCVLALPAYAAWLLFHTFERLPWRRHPVFRALLVLVTTTTWILSVVFSIALVWESTQTPVSTEEIGLQRLAWSTIAVAWELAANPLTLGASFGLGAAAAWVERRLENAPEFPLGMLLGQLTVLASSGLNTVVLILGGEQPWVLPPLVLLLAHLPIAVFEGIVLGFTLGFLAKVKPEMLGCPCPHPAKLA